MRLGPHSEPQPDLALLRPRADFYATGHPGPDAVLPGDRGGPHIARLRPDREAAADLSAGRIEVCRRPAAAGYAETRRVGRGERLSPLVLPDVAVPGDDVLV